MKYKLSAACLILLALGAFFFFKGKDLPQSSFPVTLKKPFVVIIPTYQDAQSIESTLFSVFEQNYDHYRVIVVDDHSTDGTLQKAKECVAYFKGEQKCSLISHTEHAGTLGCLYDAIDACADQEIALILQGGDKLATPNVLKTLNGVYADPDVWLTYGSALEIPSYRKTKILAKPVSEKVVKNGLHRKSPWHFPPPFTFYTSLFKEIPLSDLFYRGRFYAMGSEMAIGFPLLELAGNHARGQNAIFCLLDEQSKKRDEKIHPEFLKECKEHICKRPRFFPLEKLPHHHEKIREKADLLVFSQDRPMELFALLESIQRHVVGIDHITVYYESSKGAFESGYLDLKLTFPKVQFLKKDRDFKSQLLNTALAPTYSSSPYVLLATDGVIVTDLLDLQKSIGDLEETKAYGVYFDLHPQFCYCAQLNRYQPIPTSTSLGKGPLAWQFSSGRDDWNNRGSLFFALFRKEDLAPCFAQLEFEGPDSLLEKWNLTQSPNDVGLYYKRPKALHLAPPLSLTEELEKFLSGIKIDLSSLFQQSPPSREISLDLSYTTRE